MNVSPRLFVTVARSALAGGALALVAGGLSGCVSANPFAAGVVDPESPVAAEVAASARADKRYPSFADIPEAPQDVRKPKAWAAAVAQIEDARSALYAQTAPSTWTLEDTAAFAERARSAATPPPPVTTAGDTEAFAREMRERATPPPSSR